MEEYVRRAAEIGLEEVGFSDHLPLYWLSDDHPAKHRYAMAEEEWPEYIKEVLALRDRFPSIGVRLGVEADWIQGKEAQLADTLGDFPYDYIMGSVHFIGGWAFDDPKIIEEYSHYDVDELYRLYFQKLCQAAGSGLFDVMAHPDLIKKFGFRSRRDPAPLYRQAADTFREHGVSVEVNTSGLRKPVGEIYPSLEFLRECRRQDVAITLGSDAHAPEEVGCAFDRAIQWAMRAGYREQCLFEGRRRRMKCLGEAVMPAACDNRSGAS